MATARLDFKLDGAIKAKAKKAAVLVKAKSLTDYVVQLIEKDATEIIAQHENITLRNDVFDNFMTACNKVEKPNKALRDALKFTEEQGIQ